MYCIFVFIISVIAYFILPLTFNIPITWLSINYRPWRLLTLLMALPLGIGAVMMWFLYESPKFLANSGKNDQALKVLRKIFEINGGDSQHYQVRELLIKQSITCVVGFTWYIWYCNCQSLAVPILNIQIGTLVNTSYVEAIKVLHSSLICFSKYVKILQV